jgi:hypothetical protein
MLWGGVCAKCALRNDQLVALLVPRHDEMLMLTLSRLAGNELPALAKHWLKWSRSLPSIEYGKIKF